jgi:hypothetical protein
VADTSDSRATKPRTLGSFLGLGAGLAAGAALGLWLRRPKRARDESVAASVGEPVLELAQPVYEYTSCIVWSDDPHRRQGDLEDAESIEGLVSGGWELIDVIVPFAQTKQLELAYPGNTRKLIAYFRRPLGEEGEKNAAES